MLYILSGNKTSYESIKLLVIINNINNFIVAALQGAEMTSRTMAGNKVLSVHYLLADIEVVLREKTVVPLLQLILNC